MLSGVLTERYLASGGHASGIAAGQMAIAAGHAGGAVSTGMSYELGGYMDGYGMSPMPPAFSFTQLSQMPPPPAPPPSASKLVCE